MAKVIAICNQKGGVGKTTTSLNLFDGMRRRGYRVLMIDADKQQSTTKQFKAKVEGEATLYDVLTGECTLDQAIQRMDRGDIVAADDLLKSVDVVLEGMKKYLHLRDAIRQMKEEYDFIIVDCPPALDTIQLNALCSASLIVIPATCEIMSLEGLVALSNVISEIKEVANPGLKVAGLLLIKYKKHTRLTKQLTAQMAPFEELFETKTFKTKIRESTAQAEAQTLRQSVFEYAPKSTTACDYDEFIDEFLASGGIIDG